MPGCTIATVTCRTAGNAGVSANASGRRPRWPGRDHAEHGQPGPEAGRREARQRPDDEHDGHVRQHQRDADQPHPADRGERELGRMLPLADAVHGHGPPSACQDRSHSVSSQQLGTTTRAASAGAS